MSLVLSFLRFTTQMRINVVIEITPRKGKGTEKPGTGMHLFSTVFKM